MSNGIKLLEVLLKASEKGANLARACRQNAALFKLLIQEKTDDEKNPRFFQDFKTLADVLIQETVRHDIELEFPELGKMVKGEETNVFSNTLGKTVIIKVCSSCDETKKLLAEVLNDDLETASLLAAEIHREVTISEVPHHLVDCNFNINIDDVSIWVDPIDSTADYINGETIIDEATGMHLSGLRCVTVLIGAYSKSTCLPLLGIINQPFYNLDNTQWKGKYYWGYAGEDGTKYSSLLSNSNDLNNFIVLSRFENPDIKDKLINSGYNLLEATGAGYKILSVATGKTDAYILSKGSTYKWDTCAPQALLRSLGGDILDFTKFATSDDKNNTQLKYHDDNGTSNRGGLIAYRNPKTLNILKQTFNLSTKL